MGSYHSYADYDRLYARFSAVASGSLSMPKALAFPLVQRVQSVLDPLVQTIIPVPSLNAYQGDVQNAPIPSIDHVWDVTLQTLSRSSKKFLFLTEKIGLPGLVAPRPIRYYDRPLALGVTLSSSRAPFFVLLRPSVHLHALNQGKAHDFTVEPETRFRFVVDWSVQIISPSDATRIPFFADETLHEIRQQTYDAICDIWNVMKEQLAPEVGCWRDLAAALEAYSPFSTGDSTMMRRKVTSYSQKAFVLGSLIRTNQGPQRIRDEMSCLIEFSNVSKVSTLELERQKEDGFRIPGFYTLRLDFINPVVERYTSHHNNIDWRTGPGQNMPIEQTESLINNFPIMLSGRLMGLIAVKSALERCMASSTPTGPPLPKRPSRYQIMDDD